MHPDSEYYFIFDLHKNSYLGIIENDDIFNLSTECIAYKLTPEQLIELDKILKKKIRKLSIIDKFKILIGLYK